MGESISWTNRSHHELSVVGQDLPAPGEKEKGWLEQTRVTEESQEESSST